MKAKQLDHSGKASGPDDIKEGPFDPGAVDFAIDLTAAARAPLPPPGDGSYRGGGRDERRRLRLQTRSNIEDSSVAVDDT